MRWSASSRGPTRGRHAVERDVEQEHVHPRVAQQAELAPLGVPAHQRAHLLRAHPPGPGHPRDLELGIGRGDVRVEPGARRGDHVGRDLSALGAVLLDHMLDASGDQGIGQLGVGGAFVGAGRGGGVIARTRGRRPRVEVFRPGERLSDQFTSDDSAGDLEHRAVGLPGKEELRHAGDDAGVHQTGDGAEQEGEYDRGAEQVSEHGHTKPRAVRRRSMSLIPTNGTIRPPSP
jgi:hypothetical protein